MSSGASLGEMGLGVGPGARGVGATLCSAYDFCVEELPVPLSWEWSWCLMCPETPQPEGDRVGTESNLSFEEPSPEPLHRRCWAP